MGVGLGHRRGPSLAAGPRGGLQRGVYLVKTSFTGGGSGILKVSEGGLYISPCKTPISFIVLSQFSFFSNSKVTQPRSVLNKDSSALSYKIAHFCRMGSIVKGCN